jgi:signal peptidase I
MASASMYPSLPINSRVLLEKVSTILKKPFVRGEIIVFYPPEVEIAYNAPGQDPWHVVGRLTGFNFLPYDVTFIKRVVGLSGDRIRIVAGQGVFVNGQLLDESDYVLEPPQYSLNVLGDIGGKNVDGKAIRPYMGSKEQSEPIVVPRGQLFVLGDNRNNTEDSHVFGFVDQSKVIGRVQSEFHIVKPPNWIEMGAE